MSAAKVNRLLPDQQLQLGRVVAILRGPRGHHLQAVAHTLVEAGVRCLEMTTNTPGALEAIRALRIDLPASEVSFGVGTVRTVEQVDQAAAAGASFVVSPGTSPPVGRRAADLGLRWYPGAATATEVETAWQLGATAVKIFPAGALGGPAFLRALVAPLDDVLLIPTGGVEAVELTRYLSAGAFAVGMGSPLIGSALDDGDVDALARRSRDVVASVAAWAGKSR